MAPQRHATSGRTAYDLVPLFVNQSFWSALDLTPGHKRQCQETTKCSKHTVQCTRKMTKPVDVLGQIAHLKTLDPDTAPLSSKEEIEALIHSVLCHQHRQPAIELARRWFHDHRKTEQGKREKDPEAPLPSMINPAPAPRQRSTRSHPITRATIQQETEHPTPPLPFKPYKSNKLKASTISKNLRHLLQSFKGASAGSIYLYSTPNYLAYRKIGFTTRRPACRLSEWQTQCKAPVTLEHTTPTAVPCVRHLERLVAGELYAYRHWKSCSECSVTRGHSEWFKVSQRHATAVMCKWYQFLSAQPYMPSPFADGEWILRPEYQDATFLDWICTPLPPDESRDPESIMADVEEHMNAVCAPGVPVKSATELKIADAPQSRGPVGPHVCSPKDMVYLLLACQLLAATQQHFITTLVSGLPAGGTLSRSSTAPVASVA